MSSNLVSPVFLLICAAYAVQDAGLPGLVCDFDALRCRWKTGIAVVATNVSITIITEQKQQITYPFHLRLANGQVNRKATDGEAYLPNDIQIGDTVHLTLFPVEEIDYCVALGIRWRPGGKIPPSRKPKDWKPAHEVAQAFQENAKFKTPLPRYLQSMTHPHSYPGFDPRIDKSVRLKRFPYHDPWTYMEYLLFMR